MNKKLPIFIGALLVIIALVLQVIPNYYVQSWLNALETYSYDFQLRTRLFTPLTKFESSVAIVDIDDKSLKSVGRWPWPRDKLAELINLVKAEGAAVIALDMIFPEEEKNLAVTVIDAIDKKNLNTPVLTNLLKKLEPDFNYDNLLANSLRNVDSILGITFTYYPLSVGEIPPPILTLNTPFEKKLSFITLNGIFSNIPQLTQSAKASGFINVFEDEDGIVRRAPLLVRYGDGIYPSLALSAITVYLFQKISLVTAFYHTQEHLEGVKLGDTIIPTDALAQVIIPFQGGPFTFSYYSAIDVLNKTIPKDALLGKIIFIGTSATGLGDLKSTAISGNFPGVEIQATVADGLIKNNFSQKPGWGFGAEILSTAFFGLICAIVFPFFGPRAIAVLLILVPVFLVELNNWLWSYTGLVLSMLVPIILSVLIALFNIIYGYLFESRKREQLKEMFGQYVPASHIDEMLIYRGKYGLQGEDRDMTVMFADIRNFTTISENLTAFQLKEMLSDFFTPMTEIIFECKGTIDKYVGDLIMAFWGAPLQDEQHAQHGILAALAMQEKLRSMDSDFKAKGWPEIHIGIGVNSGSMSVGDMGSRYRRNYTVIGDEVNLASRIEGLSKFYEVEIITTEQTTHLVKDILFRKLDVVRVKGKLKPIAIFEVVCRKSAITPDIQDEINQSEQALIFYFNQQWDAAEAIFLKLYKKYPQKKLYSLYIHRINEYKQTPPAKDWDGVFTHIEK